MGNSNTSKPKTPKEEEVKEEKPKPSKTKKKPNPTSLPLDIFAILHGEVRVQQDTTAKMSKLEDFRRNNKPSLDVGECIPVPQSSETKPKNYFWSGKKKLIPDLSVFDDIHEGVLKVPTDIIDSPEGIAKHLTQSLKTELQKVRAIWWYIIHTNHKHTGIDFNPSSGQREQKELPLLVATTETPGHPGTAVKDLDFHVKQANEEEIYSELIYKMLSDIGIACETVPGVSRYLEDYLVGSHIYDLGGSCPVPHTWNRVRIDGNWYLLDAACAAKHADDEEAMTSSEQWFMADPEGFINSHLPLLASYDKGGNEKDIPVCQDKQMVTLPFTNYKDWETSVVTSPCLPSLGFRPLSHHSSGVIETEDSCVKLEFSVDSFVNMCGRLTLIRENADMIQLDEYVMVTNVNKRIMVLVRLPENGVFCLTLSGSAYDVSRSAMNDMASIMHIKCTIIANGTSSINPFGYYEPLWGPSLLFQQLGYQIINKNDPIIETTDGKAVVSLKATREALVHFSAKLTASGDCEIVVGSVYVEIDHSMSIAHVYVACPTKGEYKLKVFMKTSENKATAAVFSVVCKSVTNPSYHFIPGYIVYGPRKSLYDNGALIVHPNRSTIVAEGGRCHVTIRLDHPVEYFHDIYDQNNNKLDRRSVYCEVSGSLLIFHVRIPKPGLYRLGIAMRENSDVKWGKSAVCFLIISHDSYHDDLFPPHLNSFDGWCTQRYYDVEYEGGYKSTIEVNKAAFRIKIRKKSDVTIAAVLYPGQLTFCPWVEGEVAVFEGELPKPGEYSLCVVNAASNDSMEIIMAFLVEWSESREKK